MLNLGKDVLGPLNEAKNKDEINFLFCLHFYLFYFNYSNASVSLQLYIGKRLSTA